jgi:hypothetical protein
MINPGLNFGSLGSQAAKDGGRVERMPFFAGSHLIIL